MFGLDDRIAASSNGTTILLVIPVSVLLGLRHASDPDHMAAVTAMVARTEGAARAAARLGLTWGLGHATTLLVFGVPVVLYAAYLPSRVQALAETTVGVVIVLLAFTLLLRRRGDGHARTRSPWQAYTIGLVHGMGGTAGVGVLLLATISDHALAVVALALFGVCTAFSMTVLSAAFGAVLGSATARRGFDRILPVFGVASLAFGVWYALGAQGVVPYVL
jgi:high-affinity nickel permease